MTLQMVCESNRLLTKHPFMKNKSPPYWEGRHAHWQIDQHWHQYTIFTKAIQHCNFLFLIPDHPVVVRDRRNNAHASSQSVNSLSCHLCLYFRCELLKSSFFTPVTDFIAVFYITSDVGNHHKLSELFGIQTILLSPKYQPPAMSYGHLSNKS